MHRGDRWHGRLFGGALALWLAGCVQPAALPGSDAAGKWSSEGDASTPRADAMERGGTSPDEDPVAIDPKLYAGPFEGPIRPEFQPAPERFAARAMVRWDGTRTLAGIWVVHPLAERMQTVRIVNLANGRAADGAAFRRGSANATSSVAVSSDAAAELGIGVNRDTEIVMVAIERPEPTPADVAAVVSKLVSVPLPAGAAAALLGAATSSARSLPDVPPAAPAETAAGDGAGAEDPSPPAVAAARADKSPAAGSLAAAHNMPATAAPAEAAEAFTPAAAGSTPRATPVQPEGVVDADSVAAATSPHQSSSAPDASDGLAAAARVAVAPSAETARTAAGVDPDAGAASAGDPVPASASGVPEASGASAEWAPGPAQGAAPAASRDPTPPPVASPSVSPAAASDPSPPVASPVAPARAPVAPDFRQRYLQVGIFAVPENAAEVVSDLASAGIPAEGDPLRIGGRDLLRVVAGPFGSAAERDRALDTVRRLGITDARSVTR